MFKLSIFSFFTVLQYVYGRSLDVRQVKVPQAFTPGLNCTFEGLYVCLRQNSFQQCRWGTWSEIGAASEPCEFHGEIGFAASALMPSQALEAPEKQEEALQSALLELYVREGKINVPGIDPNDKPFSKDHDTVLAANTSSLKSSGEKMLVKRANFLVKDIQAVDATCPKKSKRQLSIYPAYAYCGSIEQGNFAIIWAEAIARARQRAAKARYYSYFNYPHEYENRENYNMHGCTGQLWEFPLFNDRLFGDPVYIQNRYDEYATKNAESERVVVDECGNLCAVLTHRNHPVWGGLYECFLQFDQSLGPISKARLRR